MTLAQDLLSMRESVGKSDLLRAIKDERGSVEAGLTLIPLTILFLISVQLVFAAHWGGAQMVEQQSSTNRLAMTGAVVPGTTTQPSQNSDYFRYETLIGGGYLLVSERSKRIPLISNGMSQDTFQLRKRTTAVSEVFTQ